MVSAGARTEHYDSQGIRSLNDPPDGFLDAFFGHTPVGNGGDTSSNGLGRHSHGASLSCSLCYSTPNPADAPALNFLGFRPTLVKADEFVLPL